MILHIMVILKKVYSTVVVMSEKSHVKPIFFIEAETARRRAGKGVQQTEADTSQGRNTG